MKRAKLIAELTLSLLLVLLAFPLLAYVAYITAGANTAFTASLAASILALNTGTLLLFKKTGYIAVITALIIATLILITLITSY
jgi:hypothetical protein